MSNILLFPKLPSEPSVVSFQKRGNVINLKHPKNYPLLSKNLVVVDRDLINLLRQSPSKLEEDSSIPRGMPEEEDDEEEEDDGFFFVV